MKTVIPLNQRYQRTKTRHYEKRKLEPHISNEHGWKTPQKTLED